MDPISKGLGKVLPRRNRQSGGKSEEGLSLTWRKLHPALSTLGINDFLRLRISCPNCSARDEECEVCGGTGAVCPICRGAGWLAKHRRQLGSKMERCNGCGLEMSEGWQFDVSRARMSIDQYIADWQAGRVADDGLTRRKADEAERREFEETRKYRRSLWKADNAPAPPKQPSKQELEDIAAL